MIYVFQRLWFWTKNKAKNWTDYLIINIFFCLALLASHALFECANLTVGPACIISLPALIGSRTLAHMMLEIYVYDSLWNFIVARKESILVPSLLQDSWALLAEKSVFNNRPNTAKTPYNLVFLLASGFPYVSSTRNYSSFVFVSE